VSVVQGSGTQGLEVVVGSGASVTTEGLGSVIMGGFGTGAPTGSAGAGSTETSAEGFRSGAVGLGVGVGVWVGMWVVGGWGGWLWICM